MPSLTLQERAKINKELKANGFGGLEDPTLFAQMATLYRTHEAFRGMLMSVLPSERALAYQCIAPRLCFKAKPLEDYEREMKEKVEREQWDIWDGSAYPKPFKVGEVESPEYKLQKKAQEALDNALAEDKAKGHLVVTCTRCTKESAFPGETQVDARMAALNAGWKLHPKQICPDCAKLYMN